ncbi:hypothetical protein [Streptomyces albogriseolus]|uniref:hypothetical protein n=1 Tax=Streptomyces albogriseolus TaxID=1887 RepID=UPI0034601D5B
MSTTATSTTTEDGTAGCACLELGCAVCFPEYVPEVGDYVKDGHGNVWLVVSTRTERSGCIQLRHTQYGHYADAPRTESGAFMHFRYEKVDGPAA